jgi:thioredoxin 1
MAKMFTDENFKQEVIEASKIKPVLVDFFAEWCGPCHVMAPIIDELVSEMGDKAVVGKLNVDEARESAAEYGVMSIPTLKIFKGGKVVEETVGVQSRDNLVELLNKHI